MSQKIYTTRQIREISSAPTTPDTNFWSIYAKSDGFYQIDDAGNEEKFSVGSSGGLDVASGDFTRLEDAPTESITYSHSLGKIPKKITFGYILDGQDSNQSMWYGHVTSNDAITFDNNCIGTVDGGSSRDLTVYTDRCMNTADSNADGQKGVLSAWTSTNFTIDWTLNSGNNDIMAVIFTVI